MFCMLRTLPFLAICVLLTACGPSGVSVYDRNDSLAGTVEVETADNAIVYDRNDSISGRVQGNDVSDQNDIRIGRVRSDNNIEDRDGIRVGRLVDGQRCTDRDDVTAGRISERIDAQAAGGACLLLLIR